MKKYYDKLVFEMSKKRQFLNSCKSFLQKPVKLSRLLEVIKTMVRVMCSATMARVFMLTITSMSYLYVKKNKIRLGDYTLCKRAMYFSSNENSWKKKIEHMTLSNEIKQVS